MNIKDLNHFHLKRKIAEMLLWKSYLELVKCRYTLDRNRNCSNIKIEFTHRLGEDPSLAYFNLK